MMTSSPIAGADRPGGYRPGVCNIGPAEIASRRRAGHVGVAATLALFGVLVVLDAPAAWRLLLFLPAAAAASGYLQAALRFCAGYGWAGVFNLTDRLRDTTSVAEARVRAVDRRKAIEIGAMSALIGIVVAIAAVLVPV
jgi:hypothetical protein